MESVRYEEVSAQESRAVIGYWFTKPDPDGVVRLWHGDGRVVRVGETLTVGGHIIPAHWGLHASRRIVDALGYAPGAWLAIVRLSGSVVEASDIMAASARETLWLADVSRVLWRFACDLGERALQAEKAAGRAPKAASWQAIATRRAWLAGEMTDQACHDALSDAQVAAGLLERLADEAVRESEARAYEAANRAAFAAAAPCHPSSQVAAMVAFGWGAEAAAWRAVDGLQLRAQEAEETWQEAYLLDLLHEAGMPVAEEVSTRQGPIRLGPLLNKEALK